MKLEAKPIDELPQCSCNLFSCGNSELDTYLKRYAKKNHKRGIGKSFALAEEEMIVGFYTISMSSIHFENIPDSCKAGIPKYPIPVAIIGKLAIDLKYQGKKMGGVLLMDAIWRIFEASQSVAAYAVIVDAKDEKSKGFYEHYGFIPYKKDPFSLFLPMKTVAEIFEERS